MLYSSQVSDLPGILNGPTLYQVGPLEPLNRGNTVDDINPALPRARNIQYFPEFRLLKIMQDLYHQQSNMCQRPTWSTCRLSFSFGTRTLTRSLANPSLEPSSIPDGPLSKPTKPDGPQTLNTKSTPFRLQDPSPPTCPKP